MSTDKKEVAESKRPPLKLPENLRVMTSGSQVLSNLEKLGSGGNGSVYRMIVKEGKFRGLIVAVKFLEAISDQERIARFKQEIAILKDLIHPHIVSIYDTGIFRENPSYPFYVMEYQPRNLEREIIGSPKGVHPDIVVPIGFQIASALKALHDNNIVHRDLKPANVLFDGTNIQIADFGLAKVDEPQHAIHTAVGKKVAPYHYMTPEQWHWWKTENAQAPGAPSDIYQFGLILYALATGFNPNQVSSWTVNDKRSTAEKIWAVRGSLTNDLISLIREMVADSPDDRPRIEDVQNRLDTIFSSYASHFSAVYGHQPGRHY